MKIEDLERKLAMLPLSQPDLAREARLIDNLRRRSTAPADRSTTVWWRRPIPLWQAAAACVAAALIDPIWLRPDYSRSTFPESARVIVQIDQSLFAQAPRARTAADLSNWKVLSNR